MSRTTETALELDVDAAGYTRGEGVHFGSFPGVWEPGRPVAVSELGFDTEQDALDLVTELALPLRKVKVQAGSAPMPDTPNHVLSQEQASEAAEVAPESEAAGDVQGEHAEVTA